MWDIGRSDPIWAAAAEAGAPAMFSGFRPAPLMRTTVVKAVSSGTSQQNQQMETWPGMEESLQLDAL